MHWKCYLSVNSRYSKEKHHGTPGSRVTCPRCWIRAQPRALAARPRRQQLSSSWVWPDIQLFSVPEWQAFVMLLHFSFVTSPLYKDENKHASHCLAWWGYFGHFGDKGSHPKGTCKFRDTTELAYKHQL